MKFKDFEDHILGLDQLSVLKIRDLDPFTSKIRGYDIVAKKDYYLLSSIDKTINVIFNEFGVVPSTKPIPLYYNGVKVGAITIEDMEVIE